MPEAVLFAKTARPCALDVLEREHVFERLDAACVAPMVWVQAPAGAGKTSALASYLEARRRDALWYQVDGTDADPATFFAVLARAPGDGPRLPLFTSEYRDDPPGFARNFFRQLAQSLGSRLVLVLDNYHELERTARLHVLIREGARALPPSCTVVAVSRESPPPAFIRLRANRELSMLTWKDLRLTRGDTREIAAASGVELSPSRIDAMYEATQGWAAALILMLDGERHGAAHAAVGEGHTPDLLFDYLAEEVYAALEPEVKDLLLRTAGVREMSASLASALSGNPFAGRRLQTLVDSHHLVRVRSGARGAVYQCHPLLREFLVRKAAQQVSDEERRRLALDAACHLEAEGALGDAYALLVDAGDGSTLTGFIERHAASTLAEGRADTVLKWIERVPCVDGPASPWLAYWRACCQFETDPLRALASFEDAYAGFVAEGEAGWVGAALSAARAMDATIYARHELSVLDRWIPRALELARDRPDAWRSDAGARLAVGLFMAMVFRQPHREEVRPWGDRALEACETIADDAARTSAQLLIAIGLNYTGQFERARGFIETLRAVTHDPGASPLALTTLKTVESMYHMLIPEPERCLQAVFDGIDIGEQAGVHVWTYHLLVNGAAGALGGGDEDTAAELLDRLDGLAARAGRLDRTIYHYLRAWLFMLRSAPDDAYHHQKLALELAMAAGCPFYEALCHLALAEVLVERGEARRALRHVRRATERSAGIENRLLQFMRGTAMAHMALVVGRRSRAVALLTDSLAIARERGFLHFLWWRPKAMARLAALALEHGIEVEYTRRLIRARRLEPPRHAVTMSHWPWRLEVRSFGRFEARCDGREVTRLAGRPLSLLRALVGHGADAVREETLARALWPRIDLEYALRSLTTTLHRLRKLLGHDRAVVLRHGRLSLARDLCWLDLRAFFAVVAEVEELEARAAGDALGCVDGLLERLFGLYRGPFMDGEPDGGPCGPLRERSRHALMAALDALAGHLEALGAPHRVPALYRQAQEVDPLAEAFCRRHMLALHARGLSAQAVEAFAQLRSILHASSGREPSAETQAIYSLIVKGL